MPRQYSESELIEALAFIDKNPGQSIASVAKKFAIPRMTLVGRIKGANSSIGRRGVNTTLTDMEEKAICTYLDHLDSLNLAVRPEFVTNAANLILKERSSTRLKPDDIPTVGKNWTSRFIQRHSYIKQRQRIIEAERKASEDPNNINKYFCLLHQVIQNNGINPEDTWNMDESGFRIGVGKDQLVITKRRHKQYFSSPENRESATVIEAISAAGIFIPAFVIVAAKIHMARWYSNEAMDPMMKISVSATGFTNDEITFRWLHHFIEHTNQHRLGARRLLILDGHGSHHTIEFIRTCEDNGIIPFGMPPHLTHLLQPLDVVIFQPLKHWYWKCLDATLRDGVPYVSKLEFLELIQKAREKALTKASIISAFKKTGIWPYNPAVVLAQVAQPRTPSPLAIDELSGSSPFNTPYTLRQANSLAKSVQEELKNSPFEGGLSDKVDRLIKGALYHTAASLQLQKAAREEFTRQQQFWQRRQKKNRHIQHGGTLTTDKARSMIFNAEQKEEEEIAAKVSRRQLAARRARIKVFKQAAKVARDRRKAGLLEKLFSFENNGVIRRVLCH